MTSRAAPAAWAAGNVPPDIAATRQRLAVPFSPALGQPAAFGRPEGRERRLRATLKALQQRRADARNQAVRDWLDEKIRIVQNAMDPRGYDHGGVSPPPRPPA